MSKSNGTRVGEALELLSKGLRPFVEREATAAFGPKWATMPDLLRNLTSTWTAKGDVIKWDVQNLLIFMWNNWKEIFSKTLSRADRSLVSELRDVRNSWAHQSDIDGNDAYRAIDSVCRLLEAVSAPESGEADRLRAECLKARAEEEGQAETRRQVASPVAGQPQAGLRPWREVVVPHRDVAGGHYQQAEFAADLWQVYLGEALPEYQNPTEFFRRTYITEGLGRLLTNAVKRLGNGTGDPVVELQTNFGGGKTHSLLALYHLFSSSTDTELKGVADKVLAAGCPFPAGVHRAVIVGTKISPGNPVTKPDGTTVRTLWGEIAYQLGGREGYEMVRADDEKATSPGDRLKEVFNRFSPALVLVDEWVAYARQLHDGNNLPAGNFATQFTFAQALSESAKAADRTLLIVSIPASDNEIGGQFGREALNGLTNAIGRVEAGWRPASADEGFEIVRRRLFEPIDEPAAQAASAAAAEAYVAMYRAQKEDFPNGCDKQEYASRIQASYPIHPELFDRLYEDWASLDKFQRTRGVLRLMASVIHCLWQRGDGNVLIMPATVPMDDPFVHFELTRYLPEAWSSVVGKDVDGTNALPLRLDAQLPTLTRYSACRRVARTIYIGSAPTAQAANRGLDERRIKLGCLQPGENAVVFHDALGHLSNQATYLYTNGTRYWYATQPTVTRLAEERAAQLRDYEVEAEIKRRLGEEAKERGAFSRVHACPDSPDVPDEREARLVILGPEQGHGKNMADSPARRAAAGILANKGNAPRVYKNSIVFLAGDSDRMGQLEKSIRQAMAWKALWDERDREGVNYDKDQSRLIDEKRKSADKEAQAHLQETWQWLLVPEQPNPQEQPTWREVKLAGGDKMAPLASKKLRAEDRLFTEMGGVRLKVELDRIPLWRGDDVTVKQLEEDFATYLYLPRLTGPDVLRGAVRNGVLQPAWEKDSFACAQSKGEEGRYHGLAAGPGSPLAIGGDTLVVKAAVAAEQKRKDEEETKRPGPKPSPSPQPGPGPAPRAPEFHRFHGAVPINPLKVATEAGKVAEEVIRHLTGLVGAEVEVTIEIQAKLREPAPDDKVRAVLENCHELHFEDCEFEEE